MRRTEVSASELAKVVSLRENNFSWPRIEKEAGVPRRIAQRAFRDWERTQEANEFKVARQTVATEELRKHLDSLKKLAFFLVRDFDIPTPSRKPQSAKDFLKSFLEQDIASDYGAYGHSYSSGVYYRQNQMLLKSLQDHTDQKDRKLNLSKWESAYDTCRTDQAKLLKELDQMLPFAINLDLKLVEAIASKKKKITGQMADGLVFLLWKSILAGKAELKELKALIKVLGRGEHLAQGAIVPDDVGTQAKKVCTKVCTGVIANLLARREEFIDPLLKDAERMRGVNDELAKILNPLTLASDILHSKCDLCPCY